MPGRWMSRSRRPEPGLLFALLLLCCAVARADAEATPVWLSVHAGNDQPAEDRLLLRGEDGRLWSTREDLSAWGLIEPLGTALRIDQTDWYALDAQSALRAQLDPADQSLWLAVDPQLRTIQVRQLGRASSPDPADEIEPGGWIDVDTQFMRDARVTQFGSLLGASLFNRLGFGHADVLSEGERIARLGSTWSVEHPQRLERLDFGDSVVQPGAWGRALRFGGLSFGSDFSLQPDLVTFPQPQMRGVAELPSTLDVYVNGLLARRETVDAGPFVLSDVPVQSGANQTRVVVRDALGREQVLSQAFYAPVQLLRSGLSDTRLDAGFLREAYGFESFNYGSGFAAASLRRGLSDALTLEARAEAARHRQAAGLGSAISLPFGGVAELALAASQGASGSGGLLRLGADWRSGAWSLGARMRRVSSAWTDLGERRATRRQQSSIHLGVVPAAGWSAVLTAVRQLSVDEDALQLLSLGLSTRVARDWFLGTTLVRTDAADDTNFIGLNLVGHFGGSTVVAEGNRADGRSGSAFEWQRNARDALDERYRLRGESGDRERLLAEAQWTRERGRIDAAVARDNQTTGLRVGATTRLAWLGPDRFWTRSGAEGFAVIDAHGLRDVGVLQDQQLATHTDARGLALMPGLRPYQANRFALVDADVPIDASVEALERIVVPAMRGGLRVAFPVREASGQGFRLVMPDGSALPVGVAVKDPVTGLRVALGADGRAWWPHGAAPAQVEVRVRGLHCTGRIPRDPGPDAPLPLRCGASL